MLDVFTHDLRVEVGLLTTVGLAFTVGVAQLGGIPTPKKGSKLALANWALWMLAVFIQWLSTLLSLIMAGESYMLFMSESRDCMLPVTEGSDWARLNVIALLTFFVHPIFLVKQLVMAFYMIVGQEGIKVFARTRAWTWAMGKNVTVVLTIICCPVA